MTGETGEAHIAMLAVDGRGASVAYRKLWVDSTEARFTPGKAPGVLEIDGWRLGLAICKDTGILWHWADTAALGIDAYVAGIVLGDDETWKIEDRSRRIADEFTVWVAMASFAARRVVATRRRPVVQASGARQGSMSRELEVRWGSSPAPC